jgi:hypothetical protein
MTRTAALLIVLAGLAVVGLVDRNDRIAAGDLAASIFGYVVRIELTVERPHPPAAAPAARLEEWGAGSGSVLSACRIVADSLAGVAVWR